MSAVAREISRLISAFLASTEGGVVPFVGSRMFLITDTSESGV
jgi:hypothetical protein